MRKWASFILRALTTLGLLAVQIVLIIVLLGRVANFVPIFTIASYMVSVIVVLMLIKQNKPSAYKVIWIIVIVALPIVGGILYLLYRNNFFTERARKRTRQEQKKISGLLQGVDPPTKRPDCARMDSLINYTQNISSYPPYENTQTIYYPFGKHMLPNLLDDLNSATNYIYMQYFIIDESNMWDSILEILERKAKNEGVDVRLIIDDLGSFILFSSKYAKYIESKGIKVLRFNRMRPFLSMFMNHRDHRKFTVIDGHTAYTGGINIADRSLDKDPKRFPGFKDTKLRLHGPAAWSFTLMFIERWNTFGKPERHIEDYEAHKYIFDQAPKSDGLVLPFGDSPLENERIGENIFIDILNQAKNYVHIFTPYLVLSEKMIYAMQMAAKRGVDVTIITSSIEKNKVVHRLSRSYYKDLIDYGVRIFEYSPGYFHAKGFVSDDKIAVVGSINLDYRSLYLHFECAVLLHKTSSIAAIIQDAQETIAKSRQVTQESTKRKFGGELIDSILHLFAPLM
jgi:cardiolipin synthase